METLAVHYNFGLVFVSVVIAVAASCASLSLSDRVQTTTSHHWRTFWLIAGAVVLGVGIWSMHYLGMLAAKLPVPVFYFWPTVLLSLLLAIAAAAVTLFVVSADQVAPRRLFLGSVLMAAGVGAMHYTGMAAMRSTAMEHYTPWIVGLSLVIAAVAAWLALWIAVISRSALNHRMWIRLGASAVLGLGVSSMHYVAMAAVHFTLCATPFSLQHTVRVNVLAQCIIAIVAGLVSLIAVSLSTVYKWRLRDLQKTNIALIAAQAATLEVQRQLKNVNAILSELSVRDSLTGLYNRRHFDGALEMELRRAARGSTPLSLLMIDVDAFKALNDGYGHQRGDDCLREIARLLEEHPRRGYDVLARYGGEEFVLLLPDSDLASAKVIAESIRKGMVALNIENLGSTVAPIVTLSIGVCCQVPHLGDDTSRLLLEADQALYAAKRLGRNRVEMSDQAVPTLSLLNETRRFRQVSKG